MYIYVYISGLYTSEERMYMSIFQDYVLVESGCTCRPKYATPGTDPNPKEVIPSFN